MMYKWLSKYCVLFSGGSSVIKKTFWAHRELMKKVWDKWMKEYLTRLNTKEKWATEEKKLMAVGDPVWVCDKQYHPFNYPMGRILRLPSREDGIFRSLGRTKANVKFKNIVFLYSRCNNCQKFIGLPPKKIRFLKQVFGMLVKTAICMSRGILWLQKYLKTSKNFFRLWLKSFRTSGEEVSSGLLKLHSTCPKKHFGEINFSVEKI